MAIHFRPTEYVGLAAGAAAGSLVFGALPFAVGAATATFGNPADAGIAASMELVAMGVASIATSVWLRFLPGRFFALALAALLAAAQFMSGQAIDHSSWPMFLASRALAGAAEGALYTLCNGIAAKARNPHKAFTLIAFGQTIYNALFFGAMVTLNATYDAKGVFVLFTWAAALILIAIALMPASHVERDGVAFSGRSPPFTPLTKRVLLGFAVYSVALYLLFPYVENIGLSHGFSHSQVALVLAISTMSALCGPIVTAALGVRVGRTLPVVVAVVGQSVAALIVVSSSSILIWGGAELGSIAFLYILTPFMFGLAAHVDQTGRAAAAAAAIMAITAAVGPAVSSVVLDWTRSYYSLGWLNVAIYALMLLILLKPLLITDREISSAAATLDPDAPDEGGPQPATIIPI